MKHQTICENVFYQNCHSFCLKRYNLIEYFRKIYLVYSKVLKNFLFWRDYANFNLKSMYRVIEKIWIEEGAENWIFHRGCCSMNAANFWQKNWRMSLEIVPVLIFVYLTKKKTKKIFSPLINFIQTRRFQTN